MPSRRLIESLPSPLSSARRCSIYMVALGGTEQKIGASFDHLAGATRAVADLRDSLFMAHL